MPIPRWFACMLLAGMMVLRVDVACGQNYPTKPIRIVTIGVGGGSDFVARLIAQAYTGGFGQQAIVDNRGGANGIVAIEIVAKAPPDGYTLLLYTAALWTLPLLQDVSYDPVKDFSPIMLVDRSPNLLVVHPSVAANSVKELIALAKARPGALNYASGAAGSSTHLAAELFNAMAGVRITRIPYKNGGVALNDLIGGQVQLMFATAASVAPHTKSGRLRALAVTGAEPSALVPGVPTVAAAGLPGYAAEGTHSLFAPARTPATIIGKLHRELLRFLHQADTKEKFLNSGVEAVGTSPEALAATIKSEMTRLGKVIKDAGIRADESL